MSISHDQESLSPSPYPEFPSILHISYHHLDRLHFGLLQDSLIPIIFLLKEAEVGDQGWKGSRGSEGKNQPPC